MYKFASSKSGLSVSEQKLMSVAQHINFGRIEGIHVLDGLIVFSPTTRIIREVKFCAETGPRPELAIEDFVLKASVRDMFTKIAALKNATILKLEIKAGLPFSMTVEEHA